MFLASQKTLTSILRGKIRKEKKRKKKGEGCGEYNKEKDFQQWNQLEHRPGREGQERGTEEAGNENENGNEKGEK